MKKGIDISEWQKPNSINYDLLAKQIDFAIVRIGLTGRATGHTYYKDSAFEKHYAELTKRGVPVGGYWYSCANEPGEGLAEAKACLSYIGDKEFQYPIWWDTEDEKHQRPTTKAKLTACGIEFLEHLEKAGFYVGVYASTSWYNTELDLSLLAPYDIWVADLRKPLSNPMPDRAGMWQYSWTGKLEGYAKDLDLNQAYKDYPKIITEAQLNNIKRSSATPKLEEKKTAMTNPVQPVPETESSKEPVKVASNVQSYTVVKGDTLTAIAKKYNTTWQKLKSFNGIENANLIKVGQVIKIPVQSSTKPKSQYINYSVVKGDTLTAIAKKFKTTYQEIAKTNGIKDPNVIQIGQKLRIKVQ